MAVQGGDPEALLLYQLIGAPLLAVVQAEAQAAQVSAEFIQRIGFDGPARPGQGPETNPTSPDQPMNREKMLQEGGDFGTLKTAEFVVSRATADGTLQQQTISIPVLSMFPIPLLQVKDAEFDFDVRILTRVPLQSPEDQNSDTQTGHSASKDFLASDRVEMKGMLAPRGSGEAGTLHMGMKIKIRMEQADLPSGLTRLLQLMDKSISTQPKTITPVVKDALPDRQLEQDH